VSTTTAAVVIGSASAKTGASRGAISSVAVGGNAVKVEATGPPVTGSASPWAAPGAVAPETSGVAVIFAARLSTTP
jgi:hypothetical protein